MKISTFPRHFRESFRSIKRNAWMSFASISAVTVTLLIVGAFLTVMMNVNSMATSAEEDVELRAYIELTAKKSDQDVLKRELEQIKDVKSVTFVSKDEELKELSKSLGEEGQVFELYENDSNPLMDVFVLKTKKPEQVEKVAEKVKDLKNVYKVDYGQDYVKKLFGVVKIVRNVGFVLIVGLLFTAMFLISNTIKITIFARKHEIEIMRLVGAKNSFIRWPFVLEGLMIGLLGSIIPIIAIAISYSSIYSNFPKQFQGTMFTMDAPGPLITEISIILAVIGCFIGMWGSLLSVRKFLKI